MSYTYDTEPHIGGNQSTLNYIQTDFPSHYSRREHNFGIPEAETLKKSRKHRDPYSFRIHLLKVLILITVFTILVASYFIASTHLSVRFTTQSTIAALYKRGTLSQPNSSGLMDNGSSYNLTASVARDDIAVDNFDRLFENFHLNLETRDGLVTDVISDIAYQNSNNDTILIVGNANIQNSRNETFHTSEMLINFNTRQANSLGSVRVTTKNLTIEAGHFSIDKFNTSEEMIRFSNGVKLLYHNVE